MWYFLFVFLVIVLIVVLIYASIKDRRRMKKRTVAAIGSDLFNEIEEEREDEIEKGKMFRRTLEEKKRTYTPNE